MAHGFRHGSGGDLKKVPVLNEEYPKDVSVEAAGSEVTFTVQIAENGKPAEYEYQWYHDDVAVSGANSSSYTRNSEFGSHTVYCVVTNKAGMVTSRTATVKATRQYFYKEGNECSAITGGWVSQGIKSKSSYTASAPAFNKYDDAMSMAMNTGATPSSGIVRAVNTIDFSKYKTLYVEMECTVTQYNTIAIAVYTDGISDMGYSGSAFTDASKVPVSRVFVGKSQAFQVFSLDVNSLNKKYAVGIMLHYQSNKGTIAANLYNMWGE